MPTNLKVYDAESDSEVNVSDEFLDILREDYDNQTKTDALKWAAKGGAQVQDTVDDSIIIAESYLGDTDADSSLDDQIIEPLREYDKFRSKFVGKPTTTELDLFLIASEDNVQPLINRRDELQYRKNVNAWLKSRALVNTGNDKVLSDSLVPSPPQVPPKKYPVNDTKKNNDNFQRLLPYVRKWAGSYGLPIEFVLAIIEKETNFRPWLANSLAFSRGGAYGVMQMTLLTARGGVVTRNGQSVVEVGLGFTGFPAFTPTTRIGITKRQSLDGTILNAGTTLHDFPKDGLDIINNIPTYQTAWQSGDDSMGLDTNHIMHPDTNIQLGCAFLAQKFEAAGGDIRKTAFNYNGDKNPVATTRKIGGKTITELYGDRVPETREVYADFVTNTLVPKNAAKLSDEVKTPLTDKEKSVALHQIKENNGGKGLARQLRSFTGPLTAAMTG